MKAREFWISNPGGNWNIDFDGPPNYTKDAGGEIIHVREVVPIELLTKEDFDKRMDELKRMLENWNIDGK